VVGVGVGVGVGVCVCVCVCVLGGGGAVQIAAWGACAAPLQRVTHCKHKVALLHCRCRDLPEHMVAQARFQRIVMVVPGGKDTIECWDACLQALGEVLAKLSEGKITATSGPTVRVLCQCMHSLHDQAGLTHCQCVWCHSVCTLLV
jgi:hypothetical protein